MAQCSRSTPAPDPAQLWDDRCATRRRTLADAPTAHIRPQDRPAPAPSPLLLSRTNALLEQQNALLCQLLAALNGLTAARLARGE